jgi:hypothetical protein
MSLVPIRMIRDFRNYFNELANDIENQSIELELIKTRYKKFADAYLHISSYFYPIHANKLLITIDRYVTMTNPPNEEQRIIQLEIFALHKELFGTN